MTESQGLRDQIREPTHRCWTDDHGIELKPVVHQLHMVCQKCMLMEQARAMRDKILTLGAYRIEREAGM